MKHLVLFDLHVGGHHGQYMHDLVRYYQAHALPIKLSMVVNAPFVERHTDAMAAAAEAGVDVHPVGPVDLRQPLVQLDRAHGRLAAEWAQRLQADHLTFLYVDHVQLSLAFGLRSGPARYSGIHFRPSFHYGALGSPARSWRERLTRARKVLMCRAMLANPRLHTLFELDPYVVPAMQAMGRPDAIVPLPEAFAPAAPGPAPALLARVEPGRRVATLFGALDDRKGLGVLLDALPLLPDAAQRRLTVVLAGRMHAWERDAFVARIEALPRTTAVQVLLDERFLREEEIQPLLAATDLVLLPYVEHVGSSGVLVRAAHAQRPVLTSSYGMLGAHVRTHRLGLALDTTQPAAVAGALAQWLEAPGSIAFDPAAAAAFAAANTTEGFGRTFFDRMLAA